MIISTNSHYLTYIHFPLKSWENVLFELGSERVKTERSLELLRRFLFIVGMFEQMFSLLTLNPPQKKQQQNNTATSLCVHVGIKVFPRPYTESVKLKYFSSLFEFRLKIGSIFKQQFTCTHCFSEKKATERRAILGGNIGKAQFSFISFVTLITFFSLANGASGTNLLLKP